MIESFVASKASCFCFEIDLIFVSLALSSLEKNRQLLAFSSLSRRYFFDVTIREIFAEETIYATSLEVEQSEIDIDNTMTDKQVDDNTQRLINAAINSYVARHLSQQDIADNDDSAESSDSLEITDDVSDNNNHWKKFELKFFDFWLSASLDAESIMQEDKDFYYRSVHLFVERIKNVIEIKEQEIVRTNLNTCLRDDSLIWYTVKLTKLERLVLRQINNQWIRMLIKWFKSNHSAAINALIRERYILTDLQNQRESFAYIQSMISYAKNASFDSQFHQLIWAWRNVDAELKRDISTSTKNISLT